MRYQELQRERSDARTPAPSPRTEPVETTETVEVHDRAPMASAGLRAFQALTALCGAVLFGVGLVAIFRVDFGDHFLRTSGQVDGIGFSAIGALAALILGAAILAAALADQDRGTSAFLGILTLLAGIGGLVAEDQAPKDVTVDHQATTLFIVLGAAAFVLSLVPWWTQRRQVTAVHRRS